MTLFAATNDVDWPVAAIAIAGIAFVTIVVSVALWQIFGSGRNRHPEPSGPGVSQAR